MSVLSPLSVGVLYFLILADLILPTSYRFPSLHKKVADVKVSDHLVSICFRCVNFKQAASQILEIELAFLFLQSICGFVSCDNILQHFKIFLSFQSKNRCV